jgi:hypothetical protein
MGKKLLLTILILLVSGIATSTVQAQGGGNDACPAFVTSALSSVDDLCDRMDRNTACYGHNRVDATFWLPQESDIFSSPADRVNLIDLQTIATAPLNAQSEEWGVALLNLQANLPQTLPGQAVTLLLMGDTTVVNAVQPEDAISPATPVSAVTVSGSNLRSRPTTAANIVGSVPTGTDLTLVGVNDSRNWYEIVMDDGGNAWIYGELVNVTDFNLLTALPVTFGSDSGMRYGPMQAFYFTTGLGRPQCNEAPDALVIQSTELAEVTLNVNELEIQLGSTIVLTTTPSNNNTEQAMVIVLVEGELRTTVNGRLVRLTRPGQGIAVTLNREGLVDRSSRVIRLRDDALNLEIGFACRSAVLTGILGNMLPLEACNAPVTYYVPPPPPTPVPPTPIPPTPVGPSISFYADKTTVNSNQEECATLYWNVANVSEVYYEGRGVTGQGSSVECPYYNTTYTLEVITNAGERISRTVTITVSGGYYVNFYADRYSISNGECVTITWQTEAVQAVYYRGQGVVGNGSQSECPVPTVTPPQDFSYSLEVVLTSGERISRSLTITVN